MTRNKITLSTLPKTWLLDIDGVIFKHNSHLEGQDQIVDGFFDFYSNIPKEDTIILLTARKEEYRDQTADALKKHNIRFDAIIFNLPVGERVLVNDTKPSGLPTAVAINTKRDEVKNIYIELDQNL